MKIAVYCRNSNIDDAEFADFVIQTLLNDGHEIWAAAHLKTTFPNIQPFDNHNDLKTAKAIDFLFSLGGDGTFLEAASIVGDLNIPIVGINTGRIGFLTGINKKEFANACQALQESRFTIESRALLHIDAQGVENLPASFALNDVSLHSANTSFLSNYNVKIDGEVLNSYWSDGLIIATPTGSTAYSLSCGGPILLPATGANVITPIASHSLSVRPIVVSSEHEIEITVCGRGDRAILTLDFHRMEIPVPSTIKITKEKFDIKTVRFEGIDFFSVIREKLFWGADKRNENETD
ncbi:NAD(+)/NADH kinase [Bacteroidales bacterium OttesenSCG-928-B11]|nr:NAD(+)/NADH kinase [Bacteroidales bacterium OttesenSCG-928-E04]MDL2312615.1 NAD(+)/NADH kinase [Bacteroidales bacterium OttesenSCG-928-B11]